MTTALRPGGWFVASIVHPCLPGSERGPEQLAAGRRLRARRLLDLAGPQVAALDDERSQKLLEHALRDPAEAVSLAAAHVLAGHGRRPVVEAYLAGQPGARADRIAQALALLD